MVLAHCLLPSPWWQVNIICVACYVSILDHSLLMSYDSGTHLGIRDCIWDSVLWDLM